MLGLLTPLPSSSAMAKRRRSFSVATTLLVSAASLFLSGCQAGRFRAPGQSAAFTGRVHGGQQPVSGSLIQLYAVGSAGNASTATPLFSQPVYTDSSGNFDATGLYTCPSPNTNVYLVSTGGNPGLPAGTTNSSIALMAMLGPCGDLNNDSYITINEVTTIGSVWPLAAYMKSASQLGAAATDAAFSNALATVNEYVDVTRGVSPGPSLPAGSSLDTSKLYTLADLLASCINSPGGIAGDGSLCGQLFQLATLPGGSAPTDTITAAINIAENPTKNVSGLFNLQLPEAPFSPNLTSAPSDWLLNLNYTTDTMMAEAGTTIVWITQPTDTDVNGILTPVPTLSVVNNGTGAVVTNMPVQVTVSLANNSSGATLSGTTTATTVNGIATFPGLTVDTPGSGYTLQAVSTGSTSAISSSFRVPKQIAGTTAVQAKSAARFMDSVGVNTHLTYTDTEYGNVSLVATELQRLGVKHIRDGLGAASLPIARTLGASGIRLGLNANNPPYSSSTFQTALSAATVNGVRYIEAFEGQNELDINDGNWVKDWNPNFAALKAADTQGIPLWGPPLAFAGNAAKLTPVQASYGTFHPYPGGQNPSILYPSQTGLIQPLFPGDPLIASETGYHNAINDHRDQPAIDYSTGAKYFPRLLLESFNSGVYRTYVYELLDEESTWNAAVQDTNNSNEQCHWGLVDAQGVEKPGFTAIRNLLATLQKGDAETGSPTTLAYSLTGGSNIHQLLLQKAPGVFDLILWQNVSSWNQTTQQEVSNPLQSVTLLVNATSVTTYQPSVSTVGTAHTLSANKVVLGVPDEALIVEINVGH